MKNIFFLTSVGLMHINSVFAQNIFMVGSKKCQTIYGHGVNINPQSWNINPALVKVVSDSHISGMGCTSFRLMFDYSDWEQSMISAVPME